jgi:diguanylate cyclase (GGDEF)-like protein
LGGLDILSYLKVQRIIIFTTIFVVLLSYSHYSLADYSPKYDQQLSQTLYRNPHKVLKQSKQNLLQAEQSNNKDQQLIALYYIAESLAALSLPDELSLIINKGINLSNEYNSSVFKSEFLRISSLQKELNGRYHDANLTANKALQIAKQINDQRLIAETLSQRGMVQSALSNYSLAIQDLNSALIIAKQYDDKMSISEKYNSLAIIFSNMNDYDNAIKYYLESDKYDENKEPYFQAMLNYNLGYVHMIIKKFDQAIAYYQKSKQYSQQLDDQYALAFVDYGMAGIYNKQNNIAQAERLLLPTLDVFVSSKDSLMQFNSQILMAQIQLRKRQPESALKYFDVAEKQLKILNTPDTLIKFSKEKIKYFTSQEMWENAFELQQNTRKVAQEMQSKEKDISLSELKLKFESDFTQEKLGLLQQQNNIQQASIVQQRTQQKFLWAMIILGMFAFIFTYVAYRNQRKIKRELYTLSTTDYLTQVANRRHIIQKLKELHQQSKANQLEFGLIMIDLDYFKNINDLYGHDIGNEVLIHFAEAAQKVFADVGRIGGEEWLILVPNTDVDNIKIMLAQLRTVYKNYDRENIPDQCKLSFSSGVIVYKGQYQTYDNMLCNVDHAMYQAKAEGRDKDVYM